MSQTWFHKPENALKRANELIAINNKPAALELLHGVFTSRRYKTWQTAYETIMLKYMDLCVQLQQHRQAKDGLHQYRNMAQQQAPGSLEVIINYLVDQAEKRATNSRKKADQMSLVEAAKVGDLEAEATPESIMLSTMTEEGEKERADREMVVPWLKFLWETYRAVLDILKTNSKLEHVYHATCIKAFNFCRTYERTTELRRLCDTLRQHISNLQKHSAAQTTSRLRGWEGWNNESIELHLQTRFAQLEVAAGLELWTEGFRTVEDIYNIMQIGKKTPKARLMASYYEKLTRIFWVSESYLFHAYAWYKFYSLGTEYNKTLTPEAKMTQANCVLLAAVSIPEIRSESANQLFDEDDLSKQKNQRMATLLGFSTDPSRQALLEELVKKGILAQVSPDVLALYETIETNFQPTMIVKNAQPHLEAIKKESNDVAGYVPSLERIVVLRMLAQLSSVYHTVTLEKLKAFLSGVSLSFEEVEKLIVRAVKQRQLKVTVDHKAGCLRFGGEVLESDSMRKQLGILATQLQKAVTLVRPDQEQKTVGKRSSFFHKVMEAMPREHADALNRKNIIEKRKEETERREQEKQREEARLRHEEEAKRKSEESYRLQREAKLREKDKMQRIERELEVQQTKEMLAKLGKKVDNVDKMDKSGREELIRKTKDSVLKEKEDEEARLKAQGRRLDYITRALRLEEMPVLRNKYNTQVQEDKKEHERRWQAHLEAHKKAWLKDMEEKKAVAHMYDDAENFQEIMLESRQVEHAAEVQEAEERARVHHRQKKIERALARMRKAEEEAERAREEEERKEREAEEASRREALEAERKAAEEEAEARRQAEKKARDEERALKGLEAEPSFEDSGPNGYGGRKFDSRGGGLRDDRAADGGGWQTAGSSRGGGNGADEKFGGGRANDDRYQSRGSDRQGPGGDMNRERNFEGGWRRSGGAGGSSDGGSRGGGKFSDRYGDRGGGGGSFMDRNRDSGRSGGGSRFGDRDRGGGGFGDRDRGGGGFGDRDRGGGGFGDRDRGGGGFGDRDRGGGGFADRDRGGGGFGDRDRGGGGFGDRDRGGGGFGDRDRGGGGSGDRGGGGGGMSGRDDSGGTWRSSRGGSSGGSWRERDDRSGGGFGNRDRPPLGQRPIRGQGRSLKDLEKRS